MGLLDVILPKRYKNQKVLFEQNLDAWRLAAEQGFNTANLNLTQLAKDCFLPGYDFTNNGSAANASSLEAQIQAIASGDTPISGTTSDTFTINVGGAYATLTTVGLTGGHTYSFPDVDGEIVLKAATQTLTNKTLTAPTITSPSITGTVTGGASYTSISLTGTVGGSATYTSVTLTTPTIADFTNATHSHLNAAGGGTLDAAAIASGTFADARIASSNVTQYQASLSIAETQIPDGSILARVASNETISGSWTFNENIAMAGGKTVDGVDVSTHKHVLGAAAVGLWSGSQALARTTAGTSTDSFSIVTSAIYDGTEGVQSTPGAINSILRVGDNPEWDGTTRFDISFTSSSFGAGAWTLTWGTLLTTGEDSNYTINFTAFALIYADNTGVPS